MNRIQSKGHRIETYEINKVLLSCFDGKIYIQNNGYDGLALGYQSYLQKKNAVILITIRITFLPSYTNIVLIFSLIKTNS